MENNESISGLQKFTNWIKTSIIIKIIIIAILILILLIPFTMIKKLINERENRRHGVINEISSKWAFDQTITGPILDIPYKHSYEETYTDKNGKERTKIKTDIKTAHFLPENLIIKGKIIPEIRKRGIYEVVVYTADFEISGNFSAPDIKILNLKKEDVLWENASLIFGINDMRGINKNIVLNWNDKKLEFVPGINNKDILSSGVSKKVLINNQNNIFNINLNIRGSKSVNFLPIGKYTNIQLDSSWKSPSFNGLFLPKKSTINKEGFTAFWEVFDYNREFPQQWLDNKYIITNNNFGVELYTSVDEYQKTTRSAKYAILFIFLTFLVFFILIELINKKILHPIQYLLVGFALCIFYLLLISLSEHLNFNIAYLISSLSVVIITIIYIRSISKKNYIAIIIGILLSCLYGFLYTILQLEDFSLLFGSIGLFIILAGIMFFTRKIDWFNIGKKNQDSKQ